MKLKKDQIIQILASGPKTINHISKTIGLSEKGTQNYLISLRRERKVYRFSWVPSDFYKYQLVGLYALGDGDDAPKPKIKKESYSSRSEKLTDWSKGWTPFRHPHDVAFFGDSR